MGFKINNLTYEYSSGFKLYNISLSVKPGETLKINGNNGSGKTTLLRTIAGLKKLQSGTITYNGKNITNDLEVKGETFAYLGHLNGINDNLTVGQNLKFWFDIYREPETQILKTFKIENIVNRKVSDCSVGQKRLVGLVRIFNSQKKILLLDEPTASLDEENKKLVVEQINKHKKNGGFSIIISHDKFPSEKLITLKYDPKNDSSTLDSIVNPSSKPKAMS